MSENENENKIDKEKDNKQEQEKVQENGKETIEVNNDIEKPVSEENKINQNEE